MQETEETQAWSLGREDPPEEDMATHSSMLAWRIPWMEEPGGLQLIAWQRVRHDRNNLARTCEHVVGSQNVGYFLCQPTQLSDTGAQTRSPFPDSVLLSDSKGHLSPDPGALGLMLLYEYPHHELLAMHQVACQAQKQKMQQK